MKVSVIMAVYNGGERMRRTIDSVLSQTYKDFEFLCINDGSTDGVSGAILDEYAKNDSRVRVVHRANKGVAYTLNECHQLAKGDYIARTDQDDIFHPQLLEYCVKAVDTLGLDFLAFRYAEIDSANALAKIDVQDRVAKIIPWNEDNRLSRPMEYCKDIASIHSDSWAHFVRRKILLDYPMAFEWGQTHLFQCIHAARYWGATSDVLYYYDNTVNTSMSHQSITLQEIKCLMADLGHMCDFYARERSAGDPAREWETVCRVYLLGNLKICLNRLRRSKGIVAESDRIKLLQEFAKGIYDLFVRRGVPLRSARLRHRLTYLWLMFKYRNYISEDRNGQ